MVYGLHLNKAVVEGNRSLNKKLGRQGRKPTELMMDFGYSIDRGRQGILELPTPSSLYCWEAEAGRRSSGRGRGRREAQWVSTSGTTPSKWPAIFNSSIINLLSARVGEEIQRKRPLVQQFFSDEPPQTSNFTPHPTTLSRETHSELLGNQKSQISRQ